MVRVQRFVIILAEGCFYCHLLNSILVGLGEGVHPIDSHSTCIFFIIELIMNEIKANVIEYTVKL